MVCYKPPTLCNLIVGNQIGSSDITIKSSSDIETLLKEKLRLENELKKANST